MPQSTESNTLLFSALCNKRANVSFVASVQKNVNRIILQNFYLKISQKSVLISMEYDIEENF